MSKSKEKIPPPSSSETPAACPRELIKAVVQRHEVNKQFIRILIPVSDGMKTAHIRVPLSRSKFYKPNSTIHVRYLNDNFYEHIII